MQSIFYTLEYTEGKFFIILLPNSYSLDFDGYLASIYFEIVQWLLESLIFELKRTHRIENYSTIRFPISISIVFYDSLGN